MKETGSHKKNEAFNNITQKVIDRILDKISERGLGSLTSIEKEYIDTINPKLENKLLNTFRSKRHPRFSFEFKGKENKGVISGVLIDHGENMDYEILCTMKNDIVDDISFFKDKVMVEPFTIFDDEYYDIKEFISKEVLSNIY